MNEKLLFQLINRFWVLARFLYSLNAVHAQIEKLATKLDCLKCTLQLKYEIQNFDTQKLGIIDTLWS